LQGVSFNVDEGEIVTLIGANGAGKSTTLKTVSGLLHPRPARQCSCGRVARELAGAGHRAQGRRPRARRPQDLRAADGAREPGDGRVHAKDPGEIRPAWNASSRAFPRFKERLAQLGGTLSGGEQQMLAIGRGLMAKPKLLLLDEPSMGLAPILVEEIFSIIQEINKQGVSVLLVEQNALMALSIAHRGYVLETGRIVLDGTGRTCSTTHR
jgi:branched-chain amino acid transport system ATP-binding protein